MDSPLENGGTSRWNQRYQRDRRRVQWFSSDLRAHRWLYAAAGLVWLVGLEGFVKWRFGE